MLTFVKLGGSLITDKTIEQSFRLQVVKRIASEIAEAYNTVDALQLLIGHGSGSFGHFAAQRYDTINGVKTSKQWRGFAKVAHAAASLNQMVIEALIKENLPVFRIQPSLLATCYNGTVNHMNTNLIEHTIKKGLIPVIYGDVALDEIRGGTITSTENLFMYLAGKLEVSQILLLGEVDGVLNSAGDLIAEITRTNFPEIQSNLRGSSGVDVTGGMLTKVRDMLKLAESVPGLHIRILNGKKAGLLKNALIQSEARGTLIYAKPML